MVNTEGHGHGALAEFLVQADVKTLIRGGIGNGAQTALKEAGIQLFGGVSGTADEAVSSCLPGTSHYAADVKVQSSRTRAFPQRSKLS